MSTVKDKNIKNKMINKKIYNKENYPLLKKKLPTFIPVGCVTISNVG